MPIRPPGLIRQSVGDNVQQISQAPTVASDSQFFNNIDEQFSTTPGSTITSNIVAYDRSKVASTLDHYAYVFGDDNGDVYLFRADTETVIDSWTAPTGPIVSVDHKVGSETLEGVVALSEDGDLYGFDAGALSNDWTFTVGGTPECLVKAEGDVAFVGQPPGQANEFYSIDTVFGAPGGSVNWTYSASGGFRGGIVTDESYVYAVGGKTGFRLDKGNGNSDWTAQLDSSANPYENLGATALDSDGWYVALAVPGGTKVQSIKRSSGNINWERSVGVTFNTFDKPRTSVVEDGERVFVYPYQIGTEAGPAAFNKSNGGELWENTSQSENPVDDNNDNRIDVWMVEVGDLIVLSVGKFPTGDVNIIAHAKDDGSERFRIDEPNSVSTLGLASNPPNIVYGSGDNLIEYNLATTGTLGPVRVGSRPFLSVGSESVGSFDVIVYGKNSETGTALRQDTVSMDAGTDAEQLPWWSWEWVEVEMDDKNVTAGDTTLYLSASR